MSYFWYLVFFTELYIVLALALNVQLGFSGLVNLAMGAFYGIGAYSYAILSLEFGFSFFTAMIAGILINMLVSIVITAASFRFKDDIFILATIAFQSVVFSVMYNWDSLTNGANGLSAIPRPEILGYQIKDNLSYALLGGVITILVALLVHFLRKSQYGLTLQAIREDELVATSLGKNVRWMKASSVAIGCGIASLAGTLYAAKVTFIDPTSFTISESIDILYVLILGGLLSVRATFAGAIAFVLLQEGFKFVGLPSDSAFYLRNAFFPVLVILLLYFRPQGLFGKLKLA